MHNHIIMKIALQVKREAEAVSKKRSGSRTSKSKTVLETLQEVNVSGLKNLVFAMDTTKMKILLLSTVGVRMVTIPTTMFRGGHC